MKTKRGVCERVGCNRYATHRVSKEQSPWAMATPGLKVCTRCAKKADAVGIVVEKL